MADEQNKRIRHTGSFDEPTVLEINKLVDLTGMDRAHVIGVLCRIGCADSPNKQAWIDSVLGLRFPFAPPRVSETKS